MNTTNPTITTATYHVLNLVLRGINTEPAIRATLADPTDDQDGPGILADLRAPGRQLDTLEALGLISWTDDVATFIPMPAGRRLIVR